MPETSGINSLSVIIPTYNRKNLVAKALEGYLGQSSPQLIHELLVVDDGSTDGTELVVREFSRRSPFAIRYLHQPNKGPAAARNLGIREAGSSVVLFTDSDIVPGRDLVAQHLEWHRNNPQTSTAVLGYVTWPMEIKVTPFMRWFGEDGALFGYRHLRGRREVDFRFFYTCNLSLKTDFLLTRGQFDEEFKGAAFEDVELGYRLAKQGLRLLFNPAAIAYHHQYFSFDDACRKTRGNAAAAELFFRREAGRQLLWEAQMRRSRPRYTITTGVAAGIAALLAPARRMLDSSLPLPRIIYHLFYWHDATRPLMTAVAKSVSLTNPVPGDGT